MARYGCSRMTVNKALSELAQADLIERRRRAGTFVRRPQHLSAVLKIADIRAEITALGRSYGYQLDHCARRAATAADRARLCVRKAGKVVAIACRHSADNVPFALEDRLIDLEAVPEAATADFAVEPPGSWLLHHVPWTEAEHTISAVVADDSHGGCAGHCHRRALPRDRPLHLAQRANAHRGAPALSRRIHRLVARFKGG